MCKYISFILLIFAQYAVAQCNDNRIFMLSLDDAIALACDSSLDAFVAGNKILIEHWIFENYKAGKLPNLSLESSAINFDRSVNEEYNFLDSTIYYADRQTISSSANLSLTQNIRKTGGNIYLASDIGRLQNISKLTSDQYSSNIIRFGLTQNLFGFNSYKWDDKIMPLNYQKAKINYLESIQKISLKTVELFFNLAKAQQDFDLSRMNLLISDTLYRYGLEKFELGSLSQEDLFSLEIDFINAKNNTIITEENLRKAKTSFLLFLRLDKEINIQLILPDVISEKKIIIGDALRLAIENNSQSIESTTQIISAQRDIDQAKKEKGLDINLDMSFGLNQTGTSLKQVYQSPKDQEMVNLSLKIPILDWGSAKNAYSIAINKEKLIQLEIEQSNREQEQSVISIVNNFNSQYEIVHSSLKIKDLAQKSYQINLDKFKAGKSNLAKLNLSVNYNLSAQNNYINALANYWLYYYNIRKLTLYDFIQEKSLMVNFDDFFIENGE